MGRKPRRLRGWVTRPSILPSLRCVAHQAVLCGFAVSLARAILRAMRGTTFFAALLLVAACGSGGGSGGGVGGAAGAGGAGLESCNSKAIYARGVDATGCMTGTPVVVGCSFGSVHARNPICAQRDGQKYWGHAFGAYELLVGFSSCTDDAPPLCELSSCAAIKESFTSTCTFADTKWGCGSGELDADCCARTPCQTNAECSAGTHCEEVESDEYVNCYMREEQACECRRPPGEIFVKVCVPD